MQKTGKSAKYISYISSYLPNLIVCKLWKYWFIIVFVRKNICLMLYKCSLEQAEINVYPEINEYLCEYPANLHINYARYKISNNMLYLLIIHVLSRKNVLWSTGTYTFPIYLLIMQLNTLFLLIIKFQLLMIHIFKTLTIAYPFTWFLLIPLIINTVTIKTI